MLGFTMLSDKTLLGHTLRIAYPPGLGQVVLRTDLDWNKEIELSQQLRMGSRRSKVGPITRFSIANRA
jgi:hypothetical protein